MNKLQCSSVFSYKTQKAVGSMCSHRLSQDKMAYTLIVLLCILHRFWKLTEKHLKSNSLLYLYVTIKIKVKSLWRKIILRSVTEAGVWGANTVIYMDVILKLLLMVMVAPSHIWGK